MLKINEFGVNVTTGQIILLTNGIGNGDYLPFEALVFTMDGLKLVTWKMENVEGQTFRKATQSEIDNVKPQFEARIAEISKRKRKKNS